MNLSYERLLEIIAQSLAVPANELSENSGPGSVATWDSERHLDLVLEIEEAFETTFTPNEITTLTTIGSIWSALQQRQAA